jgi:hypothetical protein
MQIDAASREEYFLAAGHREAELRQIDAIVQEYAPALTRGLSPGVGGSMLGYGEQPYQTRSMKEPGVWPVVAVAAQKRYLSLYVCAVVDGEYVAERYASELGDVSWREELHPLHQDRQDQPRDVAEDLDRRQHPVRRR